MSLPNFTRTDAPDIGDTWIRTDYLAESVVSAQRENRIRKKNLGKSLRQTNYGLSEVRGDGACVRNP
jgi:hypothetical protein